MVQGLAGKGGKAGEIENDWSQEKNNGKEQDKKKFLEHRLSLEENGVEVNLKVYLVGMLAMN